MSAARTSHYAPGRPIALLPGLSEDQIHEDILAYLALVVTPGEGFDFHPSNEGRRTPWEQRKFKARGGKAGIFDICLLLPGGRVAFIEVKRPGQRLKPQQEAFRAVLERFGTPYCVATCVDDVRAALRAWNVPTREVAA